MPPTDEYNPLDYENLTRNCVQELMRRGPYSLPLAPFDGAGVYALFYAGRDPDYRPACSPEATEPIYVGKAVPAGARKGGIGTGGANALWKRIYEHVQSIEAASNLDLRDFLCRYLVVTPLWITMAERFLIEHYRPAWNLCIEGFGNHDPGKGRYEGEITWWDALHPGRKWAVRLRPTHTEEAARVRLRTFFESGD